MKRFLFALTCLLAAAPARADDEIPRPTVTIMSAAHEVGALRAGEREVRRLMLVDEAESVSFVLASPRPYDAEVVLPDGSVLSARTADGERRKWFELWLEDSQHLTVPGLGQGANSLVMIDRPQPGSYEIRLRPRETVRESLAFAFTMLPISEVRVGLALPESRSLTGRAIAVSALAFDGNHPIQAREVRAWVARQPDDPREGQGEPQPIELADRGDAPDAQAGDGVYTGTFTPREEGRYWIAVRVTGKGRSGYEFQRDVGGAVTVTRETGILIGGYESQALDRDENGRLDTLRISFLAEVPDGGLYDAVVELRSQDGRTVSSHALLTLEAGGQGLAVDFTGGQLRSLAADGPYVIASVQLDQITVNDRVLRDRAYQVSETPPYRLGEFEPDPEP